MNGRMLLDTNAVVAIFERSAPLASRIAEAEIFVPSIVLGELFYGAYRSGRIAAIARQYQLTLLSRDTHFDEVVDLTVMSW